jgi:hypothetical protein
MTGWPAPTRSMTCPWSPARSPSTTCTRSAADAVIPVGARPQDVQASPISYGPNLRALVVYLMVFQSIGYNASARVTSHLDKAKGPRVRRHSMAPLRLWEPQMDCENG